MIDTTLPANIAVAARLAAAYGHTWGCLLDAIEERPAAWDAVGIRAWVEQGEEPANGWGISAPTFEPADGTIIHETGTGRLQWVVWGEGQVWLSIHRPAGLVLDCMLAQPSIYESGLAPPIQVVVHRPRDERGDVPDVAGRAYARHYSAMAEALVALGHDCHEVAVIQPDGFGDNGVPIGTLFEMERRADPLDERVRRAAAAVACSVGPLTFPLRFPPGVPSFGATEERCIQHCVDTFRAMLVGDTAHAEQIAVPR